MATKSIHSIDIDDGAFKRFADMFNRYQEAAKAAPDAWKKINAEVSKTGDTMDDLANDLDAQVEKGAERERQLGKEEAATKRVGASRKAVSEYETKQERAAASIRERQVLAWRNLTRSSKEFSHNIADATRSLLRWSTLTGLVSGLLGAGGLFGISRLASSAGNARRSAMGLGVSVGEEKAFRVNYGRVVDTQTLLTGVNEALHDVTKRSSLYGAGLTEGQLKGKNTAQVAEDLIPALKKIADQTPDAQMAQVMQSRQLDRFMTLEDFQRLKATSPGELDEYRKNNRRDSSSLNFSDAMGKAWQDLQVQLTRAGEQIENVFVKGLVSLAPQIAHLSDAVVQTIDRIMAAPQLKEWIEGLASGIKWLGDFMLSDRFKAALDDFLKGASEIGAQAVDYAAKVKAVVGTTGDFIDNVKQVVTFLKVLGETIDQTGQAIGKMLRSFIQPWLDKQDEVNKQNVEEYNKANPNNPWPAPGSNDPRAPFAPYMLPNQGNGSKGGALWRFFTGANDNSPRGVRNNNPLNLKYLEGQGAVGTDGTFGVYGSMEEGVAAARRQLLLNQGRGLDTVSKQLNKWAPPTDHNDTSGYVKEVSRRLNVGENDRIDVNDPKVAAALIAAMAKRENGREIDAAKIDRGVAISNPGVPSLANSGAQRPMTININNNTGGNAVVSLNQMAR